MKTKTQKIQLSDKPWNRMWAGEVTDTTEGVGVMCLSDILASEIMQYCQVPLPILLLKTLGDIRKLRKFMPEDHRYLLMRDPKDPKVIRLYAEPDAKKREAPINRVNTYPSGSREGFLDLFRKNYIPLKADDFNHAPFLFADRYLRASGLH